MFRALGAGVTALDAVVELGEIIDGRCRGRRHDAQITVADLTGIATQDIEIATTVYQRICNAH